MTRIGRRKAPLERFYDNALYEIATGVTIMETMVFQERWISPLSVFASRDEETTHGSQNRFEEIVGEVAEASVSQKEVCSFSKAGVDINSTLVIENSDKIIVFFLVMSMGVIRQCVVS